MGRSQYNSPAERFVQTIRRYVYTLRNAFMREYNANQSVPANWHTPWQEILLRRGYTYILILDIQQVIRRYNTAHHTTIKFTPLQVIQEDVASEHELRLPGFSPSSPIQINDFVRLKEYKSGNVGAGRPNDNKKDNTKTASHNWSRDVYMISELKRVATGARLFRVQSISS